MKICLISPYMDITSYGLRSLSSYTKQYHDVKMIFLRSGTEAYRYKKNFVYNFSPEIINSIIRLCKDCDIVGISLMTNHFDKCVQITDEIKKHLSIPVIWGGIHPTIKPEECLEYCDYVSRGESEKSFVEFLNALEKEKGQDYKDVNNLAFKNKDGKLVTQLLRL